MVARCITADTHAGMVPVRAWLFGVAALVFVMITLGGATRLTGSGLSITEWQPILGAVPPLSETAWLDAFAKYQAIPQYTRLNKGMSLDAFKAIFWWEWSHRFLGRLIGVVFAVPFAWFWVTGRLSKRSTSKLVGVLALGAAQAFIGWFMVQSGLTERLDVSQFRLALHLSVAFLILGALIWLGFDLGRDVIAAASAKTATQSQRAWASIIAVAIFVQVALGALVAGMKGGLTYNTWPLMDGRLVPLGLGALEPWYLNAFENVTAVQFNHRMMAYLVTALVFGHVFSIIRTVDVVRLRRSAALLAAAVVIQVILGIWTLLAVVPIPLALAHQAGAAALFAIAVRHLFLLCRASSCRL